jgi:uroporphyrinogen decarboxylase
MMPETPSDSPLGSSPPPPAPASAGALRQSRFLRACRGEPVDRPPVWLMRQAGRYLPEYRATRERAGSFLALCKTPELAVEVTLQPIRRFGFDAAILFSDILIPAEAMGLEVSFADGEGPRVANPVRELAQVDALRVPEPEEAAAPVFAAIRTLARELGPTPLIAFAAAPFTLACYAVEGEGSRDFRAAKRLLLAPDGPGLRLLDRIADYTARHLTAAARAGASALMVFESWASVLAPGDLATRAIAPARRVIQALRAVLGADIPIIYFARSPRIEALAETGASVLGIDWLTDIDEASRRAGPRPALQGNLDPAALLLGEAEVRRRTLEVLERGARHPGGHILNLGHGITPDVPIAAVEALCDAARGFRPQAAATSAPTRGPRESAR